ncbi:MAG: hypothetical protein FWF90_15695 [Promicromonosporaceae bacterium]|nr:hypothetical protein [Promicromonosporaceae bacterium]
MTVTPTDLPTDHTPALAAVPGGYVRVPRSRVSFGVVRADAILESIRTSGIPDEPDDAQRPELRVRRPRATIVCGTEAAYKRHRRNGEDACEPCLEAHRLTYKPKPRELTPCGTNSAYNRHHKNGEQPCEPCRKARRDYLRERRAMLRHLSDYRAAQGAA